MGDMSVSGFAARIEAGRERLIIKAQLSDEEYKRAREEERRKLESSIAYLRGSEETRLRMREKLNNSDLTRFGI